METTVGAPVSVPIPYGRSVAIPAVEGAVVYRLFNSEDDLLYVGHTTDLPRRIATYRRTKPWWREVARLKYTPYPSQPAAEEAEFQAIGAEQPWYNVTNNRHAVFESRRIWFPRLTLAAKHALHHRYGRAPDWSDRIKRLHNVAADANADELAVIAALHGCTETTVELEVLQYPLIQGRTATDQAGDLQEEVVRYVMFDVDELSKTLAERAHDFGVRREEILNALGYLTAKQRQWHARGRLEDRQAFPWPW